MLRQRAQEGMLQVEDEHLPWCLLSPIHSLFLGALTASLDEDESMSPLACLLHPGNKGLSFDQKLKCKNTLSDTSHSSLCIENTRKYGEMAFDKDGGTKVKLVHLWQTISNFKCTHHLIQQF